MWLYVRAKDGSIQLLAMVLLQDQFTTYADIYHTVERVALKTQEH